MRLGKRVRVAGALEREILSGKLATGSRLPPVRKLASIFGISLKTANLAIRDLQRGKLVEIHQGDGTYVRGSSDDFDLPHAVKISPSKSKAEIVAGRLMDQVRQGQIKVGQILPLRKTLRYRFGTSPATLNKALSIVEEKGLIHRKGSAWVAGPGDVQTAAPMQIVRVMPAWSASLNREHMERRGLKRFEKEFEKELSRLNILFEGRYTGVARRRKRSKLKTAGHLYPCIEETISLVSNGSQSLLERELSRLNGSDTPVILINCAHIQELFAKVSFRPYKNIFAFGTNNRAVGKMAGTHLCSLGHRAIAYFGVLPRIWNRQRQEGVAMGLQEWAGPRGRLYPYQADLELDDLLSYQNLRSPESLRDVAQYTRRAFKGYRIERDILASQVASNAIGCVAMDLHFSALHPLFEKALAIPEITAWVGADSSVGVAALDFLNSRGVRVPDQISLMAIEDDQVMLDHAISGCFYQWDRMAYLAAHCIVGDIPVKRERNGAIICPVQTIERGSVGRV